jgi:hypothetical protein
MLSSLLATITDADKKLQAFLLRLVKMPLANKSETTRPKQEDDSQTRGIPERAVFVRHEGTHDVYKMMDDHTGKFREYHAVHMYNQDGTVDPDKAERYHVVAYLAAMHAETDGSPQYTPVRDEA